MGQLETQQISWVGQLQGDWERGWFELVGGMGLGMDDVNAE